MFVRAHRGEFDVVVACYHDQGLIPVKLLAFGQSVNVTLGLPIVRTSVDHGTAFDIAGRGVADAGSMVEAVLLAAAWHGAAASSRAPRVLMRVAAPRVPACTSGHWNAAAQTERRKPNGSSPRTGRRCTTTTSSRRSRRGSCCRAPRSKRSAKAASTSATASRGVEDGEVFVYNVHISPYSHRGYADHEPTRQRKLLLHRQEIRKLIGKTVERGMTLVPLRHVLQERPREGRDQPGEGQAGARQARGDQEARNGSRDARGGEDDAPVTAAAPRVAGDGGAAVPQVQAFDSPVDIH